MPQRMNLKQKIVLIIIDILVLAELMVSIYLGYRNPDNITVIFLKTYLPAVIVTIIVGRTLIRRLRSQEVTG